MRLIVLCLCLGLVLAAPTAVSCRSVYTPRDSGTEPPGGPRAPSGLPSPGNFGRTPEGGMGYTDAYGNTISDKIPEKKEHPRLRPGAYGRYGQKEAPVRPLPDPTPKIPVWQFQH